MEIVIITLIIYIVVREVIAYRERIETARIYRMKELSQLEGYKVDQPLLKRVNFANKSGNRPATIPLEDVDLSKEK